MQLERGMNIQVSARPELTTASHNRAGKSSVYRWSRRGIKIPEAAAGIGIPDAGQYRLVVNYTRTDRDREREHGHYEGAIVLDPTIGVYVMVVATFDVNSLYPSIQISENMCVLVLIAVDFDVRSDAYLRHLVEIGAFTWQTVVRRLRTMVSRVNEPYRDEPEAQAITFLTHGAMRGLLPTSSGTTCRSARPCATR